MKNFINEFKNFALRGNIVDMALGIIIGAAFGKLVTSLVQDVLMPPIGLLIGGLDFSDLSITLKSAQEGTAAVTLRYGVFINNVIDFLIIAFAIFLVIKAFNKLRESTEKKPEAKPVESKQEVLLREIRDILKSK